MSGPLEGVRVADFTQYQAGPVSTLLLRDLGAEVIKIEPLYGRRGGGMGTAQVKTEEGLTFHVHNRGKKSMTVDLNTVEGRDIVTNLIRLSDVCVENFRPGAIKELGFGYEEVKKINPTMVMASISGFGQTGPYAGWPSVDFIAQAMSGLMDLNGQPGDPPTKYGVEMGDYSGGVFGALGILGALYRRAVTGKGEYVDMAMLDAMTFQLNYHPIRYKSEGVEYKRIGNRTAGSGAAGSYKCKDGYVVIATGGDLRWKKLAEMLGKPDMGDDPRYLTGKDRWEHHDEIDQVIESWSGRVTVGEAMRELHKFDLIAGPVHTIPQLFEDEHIKFRKMLVEVEHPVRGKVTVPGSVFKMRESNPPPVTSAGPLLAEHNAYVVRELLGYPEQKLRALEENGVLLPKEVSVPSEG